MASSNHEAERIEPIVLVGGKSTRFGRDKLREPLGNGDWLVDRPIAALREVFGPPVAVVGECDEAVARRGDVVIADRYPGVGPIGGIVSALESGEAAGWTAVFVLAGDLVRIGAGQVRAILEAARKDPGAWAVLGETDRVEVCVGVYRAEALSSLKRRIAAGDNRLHGAIPAERRALVRVDAEAVGNVNRPEDLGASGAITR